MSGQFADLDSAARTPAGGYFDRRCGDCRHFQRQPASPHTLGKTIGACRHSLRVLMVPHGGIGGQTSWVATPTYPMIESGNEACSHFAARVEVA